MAPGSCGLVLVGALIAISLLHSRREPSLSRLGSLLCAEHDRQLGGGSPLSSLMVVKD